MQGLAVGLTRDVDLPSRSTSDTLRALPIILFCEYLFAYMLLPACRVLSGCSLLPMLMPNNPSVALRHIPCKAQTQAALHISEKCFSNLTFEH